MEIDISKPMVFSTLMGRLMIYEDCMVLSMFPFIVSNYIGKRKWLKFLQTEIKFTTILKIQHFEKSRLMEIEFSHKGKKNIESVTFDSSVDLRKAKEGLFSKITFQNVRIYLFQDFEYERHGGAALIAIVPLLFKQYSGVLEYSAWAILPNRLESLARVAGLLTKFVSTWFIYAVCILVLLYVSYKFLRHLVFKPEKVQYIYHVI